MSSNPNPNAADSKPGEKKTRFGNFEILGKVGDGAMGVVYKARQVVTGRVVALKVLNSDLAKDQTMLERFVREARAMGQLRHPNLVAGLDVANVEGKYYICMEFVEGEPLDMLLEHRGGKLPEPEALELCRQVALALDHAHGNQYLHRDVKPANVIITRDGVAKLTDLGLARLASAGALTAEGVAVGTPDYISPEQAQGIREIGPPADLYSLGVMLYECLAGRLPFESESFYELMLMHVREPPVDLRKINPNVTEGAGRICMKLLQKDPADRFPSALALVRELDGLLEKRADAPAEKRRTRFQFE